MSFTLELCDPVESGGQGRGYIESHRQIATMGHFTHVCSSTTCLAIPRLNILHPPHFSPAPLQTFTVLIMCVHVYRGAQEEGKLPHSRNFPWWPYDINTILPVTVISALPVGEIYWTKKDSNLSLIIKQGIQCGSLHCKPIWQPIKWSYKLRAKAI